MSNIEPTEEQKQAAQSFCAEHMLACDNDVAEFLAEREAKLRAVYDEHDHALRVEASDLEHALEAARAELHTEKLVAEKALAARNEMENERDILRAELEHFRRRLVETDTEASEARARVAELEIYADTAMRNRDAHAAARDELEEREAQHLADIKALMGCCRGLVHDVDRLMCGIDVGRHAMVMRATLNRLAHYDDAKADAPATCPKCTDDARPVGDGERWVCSVCRRPCRIPLNDTEGGEG